MHHSDLDPALNLNHWAVSPRGSKESFIKFSKYVHHNVSVLKKWKKLLRNVDALAFVAWQHVWKETSMFWALRTLMLVSFMSPGTIFSLSTCGTLCEWEKIGKVSHLNRPFNMVICWKEPEPIASAMFKCAVGVKLQWAVMAKLGISGNQNK